MDSPSLPLVLGQAVLLGLALAAAVLVRPWRMIDRRAHGPSLATPLLAALVLLPWLWSWPGAGILPVGLHWSAAPLVVLVLGWPLAILVLVFAGLATVVTAGASWGEAVSLTVLSGLLPATGTLLLGHAVRRGLGCHPVAYLLGRAFAVPLVVLAGGMLAGLLAGGAVAPAFGPDLQIVAALLLALGEASWTCAIVALLLATRPQWLATWSDALYLPPPRPAVSVTRAARGDVRRTR